MKNIKNLINEVSFPILKVASKSIKCDINEIKEKIDIYNQRQALVKPDEKSKFLLHRILSLKLALIHFYITRKGPIDPRGKGKSSTPSSAKNKKK